MNRFWQIYKGMRGLQMSDANAINFEKEIEKLNRPENPLKGLMNLEVSQKHDFLVF